MSCTKQSTSGWVMWFSFALQSHEVQYGFLMQTELGGIGVDVLKEKKWTLGKPSRYFYILLELIRIITYLNVTLPCTETRFNKLLNFSLITEHSVSLIWPRFFGGGIGRNRTMKDAVGLLMECRIILVVA